ncbi:MAG: AAA family ATPase [Acidimicrobiia bacterium]
MTCPECGAAAGDGARFCASCGSAMAPACGACGHALTEGARFCPSCGQPTTVSTAAVADADEELKRISVLFCDLVGFTAHTEQSDPEAVRERLTKYHAAVRADVERFGGRVEKLMGDGVFAVFGAPVVHEDDPERAVRAALRIQESLAALNASDPSLALSVRTAVTTGEAILQLSDAPDREGIVGDVVNLASRLQGIAPINSVVVDARTHAALRDIVDFEALDPVEVKGKVGAIPIWRAVAVRSRFGPALDASGSTTFVGREHELNLLIEAFHRAQTQSSAQLVTIVGEPGVGKSRLTHELFNWIDDRPDLVWWRHGRCLPYGEGVTFWALGEIVKAHAGILEAELPEKVNEKLNAAVLAAIEDASEAEWVHSRLAPLVGLPSSVAERDELFRAWHRFLEALATQHPLVLAIEDLHWADPAMVSFLEHVLDWSHDLPILLVCTARPELYTEHPDWGAGRRDAVTLGLSALGPEETMELVQSLSRRSLMPASAQRALLERSGGNPLYVTEYVRLASERGLLDRMGEAELPLPDTIHALIAARLDLLDARDKALVQAAAVVGKVFWSGALAFLRGVDVSEVRSALRRMVQRELIRPVRRSSMLGQEEYTFVHVLARDVAYSQIPRRERGVLHLAAARWLEARAEDRLIDVAEQLAHHYTRVAETGRADESEVREPAYRFLILAAKRAAGLDAGQALAYYTAALQFASSDLERARAYYGIGHNTFDDVEAASKAIDAAVELFDAAGDDEGKVRALAERAGIAWYRGDGDLAARTADEILVLCDTLPPSEEVAAALVWVATFHQLGGNEDLAFEIVERGIRIAQEVGDTVSYAKGLVTRGSTLVQLGSYEAEADVEEGLRVFLDLNDSQRVMSAYNNHATFVTAVGDVRAGREIISQAIEYGMLRGLNAHVDWSRMTLCESLFPLGEWDLLQETVSELIVTDDARGGSQVGRFAREWQAVLWHHRGKPAQALNLWNEFESSIYNLDDPQVRVPGLSLGVNVCTAAGEWDRARSLAREFFELIPAHPVFGAIHLPNLFESLLALGLRDEAATAARAVRPGDAPFLHAQQRWMQARVTEADDPTEMLEAAQGLLDEAEPRGNRFWATVARIDAAQASIRLGQAGVVSELLADAKTDAAAMGARRLLDRIAALERGELAASS